MKEKFNFKIGALIVILGVCLLIPTLVRAEEEKMEQYLKDFKEQILKQLQLSPEKEKAFKAVEDKQMAERQKIVTGLKESQEKLEAAVAAATPQDKAKIKALVQAVTQGQNKLFASYRTQRNQELALLTPEQQGKYLVAMINWRHAMMEKVMKEEGAKKMEEKKMPEVPKPGEMKMPETPKPGSGQPGEHPKQK